MCGIAGFRSASSWTQDDPQVISTMLELIRHRGPDESGYYVDDGLAMGTVRLAILDEAGGSQPLADPSERYWICFNGEIYNHVELRRELEARGHRFRTRSDTEVFLLAFVEWDEACFARFNGAFAAAIHDSVTGELILARDRFGKRPLYYATHDEGFVFASEAKAFGAIPQFRFELDPDELTSIYGIWTPLPDRSAFRGIRQVPMGGLLRLRDGRSTVCTYQDLRLDVPAFEGTAQEAVALVRESLRRSVEIRLRSDVEVGVYLSGGLDSSVVTRLAADLSPERIRTFSVGFHSDRYDESGSQQLVASHVGTEHSVLQIAHADIAEHLPMAVWHAEGPAFRTSFVPMYLLSEHVSQAGIKVVLTGEGADEAFLGYSLFRETMLRSAWDELSGEQRRERLANLHPELEHFGPQHQEHLLGLFHQFATERLPGLFSHELRYQNGRFAARLLKGSTDPFEAVQSFVRDERGYADLTAVQKAQWLEYKTLLPGFLLSTQGDRVSLAHGVENRCPFLDPEVVACAASVNLRFDDGSEEKTLLKQAFRDGLPDWTTQRPKQPYRSPGSAVFADCQPDYLDLVLSESQLREFDWVDPVFAAKLARKVLSTPADRISTKEDQTFVLLLTTVLLDHSFVRGGAAGTVAQGPPPGTVVDRRSRQAVAR